ncbi:PilZ domain-containing protein [Haliangium ochraceum]|uniref:PilZ domain-containing protein n=1 Tax=Haliangium ochraceum TaxID=80816 RepID=UPI00019B9D0A|nr:PilZ domain-containing protein [Haliangium ochraceum]
MRYQLADDPREDASGLAPGAAHGAAHEAATRNLGPGGAFVVCETPVPVGTALRMALLLPPPIGTVALDAEVRWCVTSTDPREETGMGVKFTDLSAEQVLALQDYFASLTGRESSG